MLSGFPSIVGDLAPMPTLEGENHVMYQQTARFLMKALDSIKQGREIDHGVSYLAADSESFPLSNNLQARCPASKSDFLAPEVQLDIFRHRAIRLAYHAHQLLNNSQSQEGGNLPYAQAWNKHMLDLIHAAHAHIELFVLEAFFKSITPTTCPTPAIRAVLSKLRSLFALTAIENPLSHGSLHFAEDGYISLDQFHEIREVVDMLLEQLMPDTIALGDAWNFSDASLGSALGCKDGNVYERLMRWTRQLPMNAKAREDGGIYKKGYEGIIKPMLKSRL